MADLLRIENLRAGYGEAVVLPQMSLTLPEGQVLALLGRNGTGKTTLINSIVRIVTLGLGHAPEGRRLFPQMTVMENLRMGAYRRRGPAEIGRTLARVEELFPRLAERRVQLAGTLSGGEQQMLAIGRALMAEPRLLVLDEPSFGLAPMIVREIGRIVRSINRERGVSVLLVEQNARMALGIAARAYVLETGRVALSGPSATLAESPHVKAAYLGG